MISIIICSRNNDISSELKQNIADSIICDFEIVVIDNSDNQYSIFTAYNEGVRRSRGDILCFMHEDVLFRSSGWGVVIRKHFEEDGKIGLIGFAGAHFLPSTPIYWDDSPFISEHDLTTRGDITEECYSMAYFKDKCIVDVAVVDGMCFFIKRNLFDKIRFDEITYQGFHLYDMDISMQINKAGYKVCVCNDVLVEHFYHFDPSKPGYKLFEINLQKFYSKWASCFPMLTGIDGLPEAVVAQLNSYVQHKVMVEKEYKAVLQSKAFRLGKALAHPFKALRIHK